MTMFKSAALVGITAIVVVLVPKFFQTQPAVTTDGTVAAGFEEVLNVFRENFETGRDSRFGGSAFSVYHRGEKVVDLWGGYADAESNQKWKADTLTVVFSSTKAIASLCISMLVDRGLLDYSKPVAHYWPEFAQKGKGEITVKQMMEHKAGLQLAAAPGLSYEVLLDVAEAGKLMATAEPLWTPDGSNQGYHAWTFGPLTNELLRRVDPQHRTLGNFFREEVAEPFGIDFHIGVPLELNYRAARLIVDKRPIVLQLLDVLNSARCRQLLVHFVTTGIFDRLSENANDIAQMENFNNPAYRALEIPSFNGYGTAQGMAKLFSILAAGGTDPVTNKTLVSKEIIHTFMDSEPPVLDRVIGLPLAFSYGMGVKDEIVEGVKLVGHPGAGGQELYADPENQVAFAFISSFMTPHFSGEAPRFTKVIEATYRCIKNLK